MLGSIVSRLASPTAHWRKILDVKKNLGWNFFWALRMAWNIQKCIENWKWQNFFGGEKNFERKKNWKTVRSRVAPCEQQGTTKQWKKLPKTNRKKCGLSETCFSERASLPAHSTVVIALPPAPDRLTKRLLKVVLIVMATIWCSKKITVFFPLCFHDFLLWHIAHLPPVLFDCESVGIDLFL